MQRPREKRKGRKAWWPTSTCVFLDLCFSNSSSFSGSDRYSPLLCNLQLDGKMMNRAGSAAEASFVPSIMSFAGLEASSAQKQHTWDWETSSHNSNTFFPNAAPFFDCPPPLPPPPSPPPPPPPPVFFPSSGFPFYLPPPAPEYPMGIIKSEESHVPGRIGLNLGHRTYFSSCDALAVDRLFAGARFGLLHPLGGQPPLCQAEGCKADLSRAKHYHRRHKVCEFHSKATVVVVSGLQQRFCQQCSRFHVLAEFDEAKRSCRKRLADHNRRRRKPQTLPTTATDSPTYHSKNTTTTSAAATNPSETAKQAQNSTRYNTTGSKFTDTNSAIRKGPALSLGGVAAAAEKGSCAEINGMYRAGGVTINNVAVTAEEKDCTPSAFNNAYFRHHSLLCGSSSTTSEEASHVQSTPAPGHQHSHNLFHLGQALFEVDYM